MVRHLKLMLLAGLAGCWLLAAGGAAAAWPERPITLIVGWSMGSGSDMLARQLARGLEKELGVPVAVLNLEGSEGIFAHTAVAYAVPDGYTLGLITPELIGAYWQRQTDYSVERFTPIRLVEKSPAAFWVRQDSPWHNLKEALEAIRKAPVGTYRVGGMAVGGAYHVAMARLLQMHGIPAKALRPVVVEGAMAGFKALAAGQFDVCPDSLREGRLARAQGRARPLAVLARERLANYADVASVREQTGKASVGGTWRAVAAPPGLPEDMAKRLAEAVAKTLASVEFQELLKIHGFTVANLAGEELHKFLADEHRAWGEALRELGLRARN